MLGFLFRGLTAQPARGAKLFDAVTARARQPAWYIKGQVPDTLDGRFAVLATVTALAIVRLEREGAAGNPGSVALTERFIEVMESEHRELGLGDPTLGRTVRKLVSLLAKRTELWRQACANTDKWTQAAQQSLYKGAVAADALEYSAQALNEWRDTLAVTSLESLSKGNLE